MIHSFDRFKEELAKEDFHLYFDYVAFWITCWKIGDMAIETWMEHVDEEHVRGVEVEERWEYIAGFMKVAQGLDVGPNEPKAQEAEKVLGLFAERLGEILLDVGGRSVITKTEDLSGLQCFGF